MVEWFVKSSTEVGNHRLVEWLTQHGEIPVEGLNIEAARTKTGGIIAAYAVCGSLVESVRKFAAADPLLGIMVYRRRSRHEPLERCDWLLRSRKTRNGGRQTSETLLVKAGITPR